MTDEPHCQMCAEYVRVIERIKNEIKHMKDAIEVERSNANIQRERAEQAEERLQKLR